MPPSGHPVAWRVLIRSHTQSGTHLLAGEAWGPLSSNHTRVRHGVEQALAFVIHCNRPGIFDGVNCILVDFRPIEWLNLCEIIDHLSRDLRIRYRRVAECEAPPLLLLFIRSHLMPFALSRQSPQYPHDSIPPSRTRRARSFVTRLPTAPPPTRWNFADEIIFEPFDLARIFEVVPIPTGILCSHQITSTSRRMFIASFRRRREGARLIGALLP